MFLCIESKYFFKVTLYKYLKQSITHNPLGLEGIIHLMDTKLMNLQPYKIMLVANT